MNESSVRAKIPLRFLQASLIYIFI